VIEDPIAVRQVAAGGAGDAVPAIVAATLNAEGPAAARTMAQHAEDIARVQAASEKDAGPAAVLGESSNRLAQEPIAAINAPLR
jgi:hypothetical protein